LTDVDTNIENATKAIYYAEAAMQDRKTEYTASAYNRRLPQAI